MTSAPAPLLRAEGVTRVYLHGRSLLRRRRAAIRAVDSIDLALAPGSAVGIVGETGSGKSTLGALLLGLIQPTRGRVLFRNKDLAQIPARRLRRLRSRLALVHQDPLGALDPRMRLGPQILEPLAIHGPVLPPAAREHRLAAALAEVGLPPAIAKRFPHQVSGGQRQRAVIARALILAPELVVFDEAVSALDVSVQAQILALIRSLRTRSGAAYLFISHDLRAVRQVTDRVAVMFAGRIVEEGPVADIIAAPSHPYTASLVAAVPRLTPGRRGPGRTAEIAPLAETGCAYRLRCSLATVACTQTPPLADLGGNRRCACHHPISPSDIRSPPRFRSHQ